MSSLASSLIIASTLLLSSCALQIYLPPVCDARANSRNAVPFAAGSGTIEDPYVVCTAEQLSRVASYLTSSFVVGDDIDLTAYDGKTSERTFQMIGSIDPAAISGSGTTVDSPVNAAAYSGTFDGGNHTLSHLRVTHPDSAAVATTLSTGLFGATEGATIKNLNLTDAILTGGKATGGLVGFAVNTKIEDVSVQGAVKTTGYAFGVGGLVGTVNGNRNGKTSIARVQTAVKVEGGDGVGGLIGNAFVRTGGSIEITLATSSGDVTAVRNEANYSGNTYGGFIGYLRSEIGALAMTLSHSSSSGNVSMEGAFSGGFIGTLSLAGGETTRVSHCRSTGTFASSGANGFAQHANFSGGFIGTLNVQGGSKLTIETSSSTGAVHNGYAPGASGYAGFIGNLAVNTLGELRIDDSYTTSLVTSAGTLSNAGGFLGNVSHPGSGTFTMNRVYAGQSAVGALLRAFQGSGNSATLSSAYYNSSLGVVPGAAGASALTYTQMSEPPSFVGFDFDSVWIWVTGMATPSLR